ncbi:hypothetical protein BJV77DRAFT_212406 [Russula vinacea]|nr:hypothetical protein BJV77DRAFT_212406 [Russula vinacea]
MDTSSAGSRDRLRQATDDEINSLQESLLVLKTRRNTFAPISRLPPETLTAIFSFLPQVLPPSTSVTRRGNPARICVTHVCRQWREIALEYPRLWSYINFTKLAPAAMAEILARARTMPLHLEANPVYWITEKNDAFERQLEAHISHTRYLSIRGQIHAALERLVSSAPILESLSLSHTSYDTCRFRLPQLVIPINLFNCITPKLTSLELENCHISWKSPLLRGLRNLKVLNPYTGTRDWEGRELKHLLDALNDMPQLETLILYTSNDTELTPLAAAPLKSRSSRVVTLPSLTGLHISASARDCAFALAHLVLPALSWLHVNAESHDQEGRDVRLVIPHVTQNVYGLQGTEPLRTILISGGRARAKVVAWTMPDIEVSVSNTLTSASSPARLVFTATCRDWEYGVATKIFRSLLTHLPINSVSTLITRNSSPLSEGFWLSHARRWPLLEHVLLDHTTTWAFWEMLAESAPPDGPRLPLLTKLTLIEDSLTDTETFHLRGMLIERVEQGVPLEVLDVSACFAADPLIQLLREIVVDVHDMVAARWMLLEQSAGLNQRIGYCNEVEADYGRVTCPCEAEYEDEEEDEDEDDDDEDEDEDDDEEDEDEDEMEYRTAAMLYDYDSDDYY